VTWLCPLSPKLQSSPTSSPSGPGDSAAAQPPPCADSPTASSQRHGYRLSTNSALSNPRGSDPLPEQPRTPAPSQHCDSRRRDGADPAKTATRARSTGLTDVRAPRCAGQSQPERSGSALRNRRAPRRRRPPGRSLCDLPQDPNGRTSDSRQDRAPNAADPDVSEGQSV
jgi:hypothetical protein